ncbi:MAG: ABC transporter permease [Spirochaetales bacterium]|nr:ABC transporter permease [Spirochaetales bacterium]
MNIEWILFVAQRYMRVKRKTSGIGSAMLAVLGLGVGVTALITVLSVMNGFQLSFIEDILEISSYHIRVTPDERPEESSSEFSGELLDTRGVKAVLPFIDVQTLYRGDGSDYTPGLLRAVPPNVKELDSTLIEQLNVERGSFDLDGQNKIVIGFEMAYRLGVDLGDIVSVVSMAGRSFSMLSPETVDFMVTGIFRSGYYEFDSGLSFISLEGGKTISDSTNLIYGLKLEDSYKDEVVMNRLFQNGVAREDEMVSWRMYNKAFFGALRMEKNAMKILVGLIFLVVGVNIYHSQKRNVMERQEEIGIMRTLGASPGDTMKIFLVEGMLIGLVGAAAGTLLGLLVSMNIQFLFTMAETIGNFGVSLINSFIYMTGSTGGYLRPVTRAFFYLPEVPVRVLPGEVLMIFLFAFFSSVAAAYFAGRRIMEINPASVLRYE